MTNNQRAVFVGHLADDLQPTHGDADGETKTFRVLAGPSADGNQIDSSANRSYEVVIRDRLASVIREGLPAGTGVLVQGQIVDHRFRGSGPDTETVTRVRLEALSVLARPTNELRAQTGCERA